jgi:hypothetical protein
MSTAPVTSINPAALIKVASPVAVDFAAYACAKRFFSTRTSYAAASLAGAAALVVFCSSTQKQALHSGLLYLAYKVLLLVLNYRSSPDVKPQTSTNPHAASPSPSNGPANSSSTATNSHGPAPTSPPISSGSSSAAAVSSNPKPRSPEERRAAADAIRTKFEALVDKLTFTFDGTLNIPPESTMQKMQTELYEQPGFTRTELALKMFPIWSSITQECDILMKVAAGEMAKCLLDIRMETQDILDPGERRKAIATLLIPSLNPSNPYTLPYIYRFARNIRCIIHCPNVDHKHMPPKRKLVHSTTLNFTVNEPFYHEGTRQNEWRKLYNRTIALYNPYLPHLPETLRNWLEQDN